MNDIKISGSSELRTKDTGGEVFLSQFPLSVNAPECNGMEPMTKEDDVGLDRSVEMVQKIAGEEGENLMDDIHDGEEGDLLLPRLGSVDGIQVNQDAEDRIPSSPNAKSTGDGIQDDPDGEETLATFKRPRRSKKSAVKDALEDDKGNEVNIYRDKDKSLSKDKAVRESDGENLMDNTQADPDGELGDGSSPKSRSVLDGMQVIQDAEESIWSPQKAKSIGDGMQDDPDGQETLAKFKRLRRSKKTAVKVALEDDVGNLMEVPIDKDESLSKDKAVRELDGENLMDNTLADPDGEVGDLSSPKSRSVLDGMQVIQDAEESIWSPQKAKSIGDGMQDNPDGQETLAKFKRLRRSKKTAVKVALEDVGNMLEVPIDKDKILSKDKAVRESDGENLMDNNTQADPDGEVGDHSSPKSRSVLDSMQVIQDAEESIWSLQKAKSIGDGMQDDLDGQETLAKFKRLRRSKKTAVKVALEDDVGNLIEVPIDKDKSLSKDKAVQESDGENLMDDIQADPDGKEGDHSSPKSRGVVDGMQAIQDAEESIPSPLKAKSIRDGMRVDSDGQETVAKFKRLRRSKKEVVKVALQDDVGKEMEAPINKDKSLSKDKAIQESDGENLMNDNQSDSNGEQGDQSSPKSRSVLDGMQVILDEEESIPSLPKAKSIGDSMQADPDGQETVAKFKRLRRSKKAAVKVAIQDDVGDEVEVPIDKDRSLSKDKTVRESDGENLMDETQVDPDGEEGDHLSRKSINVVDGMQVIQDAEESIPTLPKAKSIGGGMQDDPDGRETLAKFRRSRRSRKAAVKVALQDDVENEMEVPIDTDKSLLKDKAVQEMDGENLLDNIQADPDREEGDQSLPKSGSVMDGIQVAENVEEVILSLPKAKSSSGDGIQEDPDGEETLAKFKRPRRSKKAAVKDALEDVGNEAVPRDKDKSSPKDRAVQETDDIPAKIKKPRRLKKHEVKDALEVDVTKATETSKDTNRNLEGNIAEYAEDTPTHSKKKKKTPKSAKDLPKVASASRQASASENDIKETANTDQVSKGQRTAGSSQGSPSALAEKTRASKGTKLGKGSLESNPEGAEKGSAVKASDIKKGKKQSDSQRAVRQVKKRRHGDMAYEGDSDWDVLMNGEEALEIKNSVDKERLSRGRNRAGLISSMSSQVVPGEEAAVAAGLKVRQPGPAEKIKFRDVLKRRGGLQEYLECRNSILWLWDKDVRRILPLSECGVSSIPLPEESPRDALIRDVYKFLDYHGYINVGVAVKKPRMKDDFEPKLKLSKESMQTENCGDKVADAEEEVAFILGQIKVSEENLSPGQNQIQVEGENQISLLNGEYVKRNKLAENFSGLTESDKKDSEECGIALMEIDETPLVVPHAAENSTAEAVRSSAVKTEIEIESAVADEDNVELGARNTSGSGGTEGEVFLGKDDGIKIEVDPMVKVHSALDQIKNSYGEDEFSDIDSAKVLHNLRKHDLQADLQTDKQEAKLNGISEANDANSALEGRKRIIVIGGGPAGLAAARHLQRLNCHVTVLEARDRVGGRVYTDRSALSVPVDLGASIITGVEADVATERRPDPSALLCTQLGLELTVLNSDCPLYDSVTGQKVPAILDETLEADYNSLLDDMLMLVAQNGDVAMRMSLEEGLEYALKKRRITRSSSTGSELASSKVLNDPDSPRTIQDSSVGALEVLSATVDSSLNAVSENNVSTVAGIESGISMESQPDKLNLMGNSSMEQQSLSPLERRVMDWHFANLEYGCAAELSRVSLPYWNQDDAYGGFGGAHCMIKGGYSTVMEALAEGLNIHLGHIVTEISYSMKESKSKGGIKGEVKVWTENSQEFVGDAVLITVPLGCLKANTIKFSPALPDWKLASIQQLGFGVLNKVIMEFPKVFWDESVDYFGATAESTELRGRCFMFWNLKKTVGAPVLIALVVGKAAIDGQNLETSDHVNHAVMILRKLFGETAVPDPIGAVATNWGSDPFSRGAYSYVAVGASGEDYDILGRPVENCLFFAGEATCKEHPDTVGGAMMSGLREAVRIIDILENREDSMAEAEAMAAAQRQSDSERNEVRDMVKRLDAGELSSVLCKGSLDGEQKPLSKDALLQDMFGNAKTTAGRLFLAKKMLQLPAAVKAFAGTKEGLSILNKWILDSMGKDGTQLLRHCVRLLLIVSTDMIAVRQSGIGRTVKEKVCVHTSRDIRAVASQLVKMWIEVFRKEKANGGFKLLKQLHGPATNPSSSDAVKAKSKEQSSGKPSATAVNDVKENTDQSPSSPNNKNLALHSVQVEEESEQKKEANSVGAQTSDQLQPKGPEDCALSELEAAAIAAEEAARAAAAAAAEAYATSEAECSTFRELPKIPSFHKFARREQYVQKEDSDVRKRKWSGAVLGKQDCSSEIDSRSCRVRNWSVDFAATCGNLDSSRLTGSDFGSGNILPTADSNKKQRSHSNDVDSHSDLKERSAETGTVDSKSTKNRIQNSGSITGVKIPDSRDKQPYSLGSHSEVFDQSIQKLNEKCSSKIEQLCIGKARHGNDDKGVAEVGSHRGSPGTRNGHKDETRGAEHIKKGITDYIASLLMPLYKTKKIDKDGYKSIMKKSTIKVMEHNTPAENAMTVSEFLDCKRRNKIRSLVDKFIEKHLASTQL